MGYDFGHEVEVSSVFACGGGDVAVACPLAEFGGVDGDALLCESVAD